MKTRINFPVLGVLVLALTLALTSVASGAAPPYPHGQIIEHGKNVDIEVYYPVTSNKEINKKLAVFAKREVANFKKDLPYAAKPPSGSGNELSISFDTYQYSTNIITFKFDLYSMTTSMAHPWNNIVTKTYDLARGKELTLAEIFKPKSPYLQELSKQSIRALIAQMPNGDKSLISEGAAPKAKNFERFALTEKELIIFFDRGQVAWQGEDAKELRLPYAGLKNFIGPDAGKPPIQPSKKNAP